MDEKTRHADFYYGDRRTLTPEIATMGKCFDDLSKIVNDSVPDSRANSSRHKATAMTKLLEARHFAIEAMVQHYKERTAPAET